MDFVRGARLSRGGKAIISLPSMARNGMVSRIVPTVQAGSGVVTTRGHVEYVATEFGVVDLAGKSLRQRAELLISIAHPDARPDLVSAALKRHHSLPTGA
jgi:acyl-CoA hydrolase